MDKTTLTIFLALLSITVAELPSPYQYNVPQPQFPPPQQQPSPSQFVPQQQFISQPSAPYPPAIQPQLSLSGAGSSLTGSFVGSAPYPPASQPQLSLSGAGSSLTGSFVGSAPYPPARPQLPPTTGLFSEASSIDSSSSISGSYVSQPQPSFSSSAPYPPAIQPRLPVSAGPSFSLGAGSSVAESFVGSSAQIQPRPQQSYSLPSAPYPPAIQAQQHISAGSSLSAASSLSGSFIDSNLLDHGLRSQVSDVLVKEESRSYNDFLRPDRTRVVAVALEEPRTAINVAQFVIPVAESQGSFGQATFQQPAPVVPAPQYGVPY